MNEEELPRIKFNNCTELQAIWLGGMPQPFAILCRLRWRLCGPEINSFEFDSKNVKVAKG